MAIVHMDGFDTYTAIADVGLRYSGSSIASMGLSTTAGRFGGGCVALNSSASGTQALMGPITFSHSGASAMLAGGAFFGGSGGDTPIIVFYNSTATTSELTLAYVTGTFRLYRGTQSSGTLLASAAQGYPAGVYHSVEIKATVADAGGAVEVRINGVAAITYSGDTRASSTGTAGTDRIYFCTSGTSATLGAWDDIYVMDTSGSVCNDFIGDVRINTLAPTSDAAVQFTKSTGASNFSCVDEGRYNSDTDYVESATVGHIDRFGYTDLAAAVATVYGVQPITWCRKTDATVRTMRNKLVSGATTSNGSSFALTTSYLPMVTTYTLDPNTSAQWTVSNANAATAGFEVLT